MKWASAMGLDADWSTAVDSAAVRVRAGLGAESPDLLLAFVSPHFRSAYGQIAARLRETLPAGVFCGCSAIGVIGGGREVEQAPAVSLIGASLPGVTVRPYFTDTVDLPDEDASPSAWTSWLGLREADGPMHFILLADPFSANVEGFVGGLDYAFPDTVKVGGVASGAGEAGQNAIFVDEQVYREGLLAIVLSGNVEVDTIVAQGCRPVGEPMTITCCNNNLLLEVDGSSPAAYLQQLMNRMDDYDRTLLENSLFLGLEMDPLKGTQKQGDFLIRNLLGVDHQSGAMATGVSLHEGQVIQFHLRDKQSAAEDLQGRLDAYRREGRLEEVRGSLLFSCMGRGQYLYGAADHDSRMFQESLGDIALGGFFGNGEIGPVGASTYIHGYTSAFALFRPAS
jgi:small ligand-binding sensory domain FIST